MRKLSSLQFRLYRFLPLIPAIAVVCGDASRRWARIGAWSWSLRFAYVGSALESALLWGGLLTLASRRRGGLRWLAAGLLVVFGTLSLGTEQYFFAQYGTYLNLDSLQFGASFLASVKGQLLAQLQSVLWAQAVPLAILLGLVLAGRRIMRPRVSSIRRAAIAAPAGLIAALLLPCSDRAVQAATPDVIWLHSMAEFARRHPARHRSLGFRKPVFVPSVVSSVAPPRNVLLVITESVRYDVVCPADARACETTPFTAKAAPDRIALRQMRANSSTTAIELAVMWSGLSPSDARNAILGAPLLFDYATAAGFDTGYWTGHHPMFANTDAFIRDLPVSHRVTALELEPDADIDLGAQDRLVTERALRDLGHMREPWFAVVQYSNTHFPYRVDDDAPFEPSTTSKDPNKNAAFFNYYRNAVYSQDRAIGALVASLRETEAGRRAVILFTSDHGEAFREHAQMGHTNSLFDEEVHIPMWIDAPGKVLSDRERAGIEALRDEPTWHLDVAPTVLDLLGLLSTHELAHYTSAMRGVSLLRGVPSRALVPMTNCTELWGCAFRNWGMMQGFTKVEARQWDLDWHCWDLQQDPSETRPAQLPRCATLSQEALRVFGALPKDSPAMLEEPDPEAR